MHSADTVHVPIPYPPIEQHALIGDRRTAALVAADGTIDWFCLPRYDGQPVFGGLLDAERGGHWRLGPLDGASGQQTYLEDTTAVITTWSQGRGELELTDVMAWPLYSRANGRYRPPGGPARRSGKMPDVSQSGANATGMEMALPLG